MRIANNTLSDAMLRQIQQLTSDQAKLQQQVGTGRRITNPEDDPAAVGRVLNLQSEQRQLTQYTANANRALMLSQSTFSALKGLKNISDRANELATLGTGTMDPDALKAYAIEVNQLLEQGLQLANSTSGGDYIFAGTDVANQPFEISGSPATVAYNGNSDTAPIQLSEATNVVPVASGATNTGIADMLNALISLRDALNTGISNNVDNTIQSNLVTGENTIINAMAEIGGVQTRIEAAKSQQADGLGNLESLVAAESSLDLPSAIVRLSQTQTAYQAALASTSKVMSLSLLDYIR